MFIQTWLYFVCSVTRGYRRWLVAALFAVQMWQARPVSTPTLKLHGMISNSSTFFVVEIFQVKATSFSVHILAENQERLEGQSRDLLLERVRACQCRCGCGKDMPKMILVG